MGGKSEMLPIFLVKGCRTQLVNHLILPNLTQRGTDKDLVFQKKKAPQNKA